MKNLAKLLFGAVFAVVTVWSFHIPPALGFQQPQLARIFVWHLPCPLLATILLLLGGWFSLRYMSQPNRKWDERAAAANELAFLFCLLTMATGILFSEVQWGAWWQWDPRQTSFLMVLFVYAAYFAVRSSFSDPERRANNSAVYCLASLLPVLFLIYGFPNLPQVKAVSFHPTNAVFQGRIKGEYLWVMLSVMALESVLVVWLYRLRVRAGILDIESENYDERLATDRGNSASTGVVRRVSVPHEG